jgi:hypothetical protein
VSEYSHEYQYEKFRFCKCGQSNFFINVTKKNSSVMNVAIKIVVFMNVAEAIIFMNRAMKIMLS